MAQQLPIPPLHEHTQIQTLFSYVIIDCAHFDKMFYERFINNTKIKVESLFARTLDEESAEAGPLIIQLNDSNNLDLIAEIQEIEQNNPAIVWLWSEIDFTRLADNTLKPLLYGSLEDGTPVLVRYYDPRCIEPILANFKTNNFTAKRLANIKAWAFKKNGQYYYLT